MKERKLDLHRLHLAYDVNVKTLLDMQKEERDKFFHDIERNNIIKSGNAYTKTFDFLFRQIESRTSVYFKSLFEIIPADSEFEPEFRQEIVSTIDNFIDQSVVKAKTLIEARISKDRLGDAVRDSILNDVNIREIKVKAHFRKKAGLEFLERKEKASANETEQKRKPISKIRKHWKKFVGIAIAIAAFAAAANDIIDFADNAWTGLRAVFSHQQVRKIVYSPELTQEPEPELKPEPEPEPPSANKMLIINISRQVERAKIYVDGQLRGSSPTCTVYVSEGIHAIAANYVDKLNLHYEYSDSVYVTRDTNIISIRRSDFRMSQ